VQRGYDVRFVPVLSFRPGKDGREKLKECLEAVERYSGLVVTSQQAVHVRQPTASVNVARHFALTTRHTTLQAVDDCGVTSDVLRAWVEGKKKLFGVGPQTSEKLEATFRSALSGDSTLSFVFFHSSTNLMWSESLSAHLALRVLASSLADHHRRLRQRTDSSWPW
jgi:uroporphyrinogen-III synthase